MSEIIETSGNGKYRVCLLADPHPANPRTDRDTNLTNVITLKGQRYIDVDENGGPLQDGWDRLSERYDDGEAVKIFTIWARVFHGIKVVEDRPYDGAWSLWYVMPEKLAETPWPAERVIAEEIKEYRSWAEGDAYGIVVEKAVKWTSDVHGGAEMTTWETVEDHWGYIGHEYAVSTARETFEPYAKENTK